MALKELNGSKAKQISSTGISAVRLFQAPGASYTAELTAAGIAIGAVYPDGDCFVSGIQIEGMGKCRTGGVYDYVKITVNYSTGQFAQSQETGHTEESIDFGGEFMTKDKGIFECGIEAPAEIVGGTFYPLLEYRITKTIENINKWVKIIRDTIQKVNAATWQGGKPESWLFEGANARAFYTEKGIKKWLLSFRFLHKDDRLGGWNKRWHGACEKGAKYEKVTFGKEKKQFHERGDFSKLAIVGGPIHGTARRI